jgi:hypothetical protein
MEESMLTRALESSRRPAVPKEAFPLPADGPFAFLFVRTRCAVRGDDDPEEPPKEPKPTATDAHTTGHDGASPNPLQNEELDWENDD